MMTGPIVVVDDEPYILRSVKYLLTNEGFEVETAGDGQAGLDLIRAVRPPLVILDLMMPRMDGYQVCEQIKQDPELGNTYVLILSAKGQQIDRERAFLGGADAYVTKPFSPSELLALVREFFGRDPSPAPPGALPQAAPGAAEPDRLSQAPKSDGPKGGSAPE